MLQAVLDHPLCVGLASPHTSGAGRAPLDVGVPAVEAASLAYTFDDAGGTGRHRTQYFEIYANRGICHDGWCAASLANVPWLSQKEALDLDKLPWELYHVDRDFSQADNLAADNPGKLRELQDLWWAEAARNKVLPVDMRPLAALIKPDEIPSPTRGLKFITYRAGVGGIMEGAAPHLTNTSFTLTADLNIPTGGAEGVLFTIGGYTAGIGWYVQSSRLVFSYNFFTERTRIVSTERLPSGRQTVRAEFAYDGGGAGKGAAVRLYAGDRMIGEGRVERTVPVAFSSFDGLDVSIDRGSPVDFTYKPPFVFTGKLGQVTVELKPETAGFGRALQ